MAKTIPADEKVFMVSKTTNTTYSGSAALKAMNEWYTMDDVTNTVRPYKVYTALLTQSGGDDPTFVEGDGELQVGRSYEININNNDIDFTPYGAPNNNIGTKFVCTVYFGWIDPTGIPGDTQLLYNTGAPVATVLENTIGNIWFTYNDVGQYDLNSDGLFIQNKTYCSATLSNYNYDTTNAIFGYYTNNILQLITLLPGDSKFNNSDTSIEIRVYN